MFGKKYRILRSETSRGVRYYPQLRRLTRHGFRWLCIEPLQDSRSRSFGTDKKALAYIDKRSRQRFIERVNYE